VAEALEVVGSWAAVGDKKRWGVMRKTNLTQSRKGAKEKRKKAQLRT